MKKQWTRWTAALLLPALLLVLAAPPVRAQTTDSSNLSAVGSTSDDDDKTNDYILIGFFAVVVGLLVVLGIRSDFNRWGQAGGASAYAADDGSDPDWEVRLLAPEPGARVELTGTGLRATF